MARLALATEGTLLLLRDAGENGQMLTFLSPTQGLVRAYRRLSLGRASRQSLPDLFDEASLRLDAAREGEMYFIREYTVLSRRARLGQSYPTLRFASRFALLLTHHIFPPEEAPACHSLLHQGLDAWETHRRPDCTYLKSLFLFARRQGFPVRDEWLEGLSPADREAARDILFLPLPEQSVSEPVAERLISAFEHYLRHSHEVRFD
jgi:recombinational DNA repair protein (RecF pathway)